MVHPELRRRPPRPAVGAGDGLRRAAAAAVGAAGGVRRHPEAKAHELDVYLLAGETIRPDASRLFRSRPGETRFQNPFAEADGQPGVVYRWLEVEGPIPDAGTPGRKLLFGDLPVKGDEVISANPKADAERLLRRFVARAYRRPVPEREQVRFLPLVRPRHEPPHSSRRRLSDSAEITTSRLGRAGRRTGSLPPGCPDSAMRAFHLQPRLF